MKISYLQKISRACLYSYLIRYQIIRHVAFTVPNLLFLCLTATYIEYVIRHCHKTHLVNVYLIIIDLIVHIKSQLSYAAITEKFCIGKLYKKSTRKMRMVSRSWQNCPQGRGFCLFFLPLGRNFAKLFCPGAGNLTTLKNSPGIKPGGCWCLELTDVSDNLVKCMVDKKIIWQIIPKVRNK